MSRGGTSIRRNPGSGRSRAATNATYQLLHRVQSRSQALLRSKQQNNARLLNKSQLLALNNPRRGGSKADKNFLELQETGNVAKHSMKLAEDYLLDRLEKMQNDPTIPNSQGQLLLKNSEASKLLTNEYVHGLPKDVDGNTIHFVGSNSYPYIIIADYEALQNFVVYVEVFEVIVENSRGKLPCTFSNPEGSEVVLATRPAPVLGSMFIPLNEFFDR